MKGTRLNPMTNLKYSAATTSTITKNKIFKSPTKPKSPLKALLPSHAKYKQNLAKKVPDSSQKLEVNDYNVQLDYQLSRNDDIIVAINTIVENQWSELSSINLTRSPKHEVVGKTPEQLVFELRGLSMAVKADIIKFRAQLPQGLVTMNQLYSIFQQEGNTFVDKSIELAVRQRKVRKFIISNASPIILNINKPDANKMAYGFENVEVVVKTEAYCQFIDRYNQRVVKKFKTFVLDHPPQLYMTTKDGFSSDEMSELVSLGLLTLTSNHLNQIDNKQYTLAYPNCGVYLRLVNCGRSWITKTLAKSKYKELLEDQIFKKWQGDEKRTNFRKPFYGYDLNWILADCLGSGIIEVFNTPVGRGWKLTGKR